MSALELDEGVLWQRALEELAPPGLGRPVPATGAVPRGLGRQGFAPELVAGVAVRGRGRDRWSMRFWDACDLLADTGMKLVGGLPGVLLSVLRPAAPRVEDRRVTVTLHSADSPGAPGVVVYAPNNHGHIYIELAAPGKETE
jgi:hypothetical protein